MAYINFVVQPIVVLNGFEAAAYLTSTTSNDGEPWREEEFDDLMEYGLLDGRIHPLADDQFAAWSIEPAGNIFHYSVEHIVSETQKLYYVMRDKGSYTQLGKLFDSTWLAYRTYVLRARFDC